MLETAPLTGTAEAQEKPLILLVEDNKPKRETIATSMRKAGFEVIATEDPFTAVQAMKGNTRPLAAVVTDASMPPSKASKEETADTKAYWRTFGIASETTQTMDAGIVLTKMIRDGKVEGIAADVPIVMQSTTFGNLSADMFGQQTFDAIKRERDELQASADTAGVNKTASKEPADILNALRELGIVPAQRAPKRTAEK